MTLTAEELFKKLTNMESVLVNGHYLDFDGNITWYTNPYGVDGCLGNSPTIQMCTIFLENTNKGIDYGLTPT